MADWLAVSVWHEKWHHLLWKIIWQEGYICKLSTAVGPAIVPAFVFAKLHKAEYGRWSQPMSVGFAMHSLGSRGIKWALGRIWSRNEGKFYRKEKEEGQERKKERKWAWDWKIHRKGKVMVRGFGPAWGWVVFLGHKVCMECDRRDGQCWEGLGRESMLCAPHTALWNGDW